jgi:putative zinc- or iron-chelating protein
METTTLSLKAQASDPPKTRADVLADGDVGLSGVSEALEELHGEIAGGLLYTHHRANTNTNKTLEVTSFAYALIELLIEKGLLTEEELNERKRQVAARLAEKFRDNGMGVVRQEPEYDKYNLDGSVEIDCESRLQFCHAACCRLQFALSRQDVEEGVLKWDFSRPYMIKQDHDGYCAHLDRQGCRCSVYQHRPVPCRAYDCRNDQRIWVDFERKIVNPELEKLFQHNGDGT